MPQNIVDSNSYTTTIQGVAAGDAVTAANNNLGIQGLANRTTYLKAVADSKAAANGLAPLDASSKVPIANIPRGTVQTSQVTLAGNSVTSSTSFVDSTLTTSLSSPLVGDIVLIDALVMITATALTNPNYIKIVVVDGGVAMDTGTLTTLASGTVNYPLNHLYTIVNGGSLIVKIQYQAGSGQTITMQGNASAANAQSRIRLVQIRP